MNKQAFFDTLEGPFWPEPRQIERYFIASNSEGSPNTGRKDSWSLHAEGLYGTSHLTPKTGRVDVHLYMVRNFQHGVMFAYSKWDGRTKTGEGFSSKGDLTRLREWVPVHQGGRVPVGLFVPFPDAWSAIREFLSSGGERPTSIEWIDDGELPADSFRERKEYPEGGW